MNAGPGEIISLPEIISLQGSSACRDHEPAGIISLQGS